MKKMNFKRGFTLIELLVVVAIIGVLSSVVLASLNSARTKGADAAVKANLAGARAQAEIFYDGAGANTYTGVCVAAAGTINSAVLAAIQVIVPAATAVANVLPNAATTATTASCNNDATTWAAQSPLKTGGYWCVDSAGASKYEGTALGATSKVCT